MFKDQSFDEVTVEEEPLSTAAEAAESRPLVPRAETQPLDGGQTAISSAVVQLAMPEESASGIEALPADTLGHPGGDAPYAALLASTERAMEVIARALSGAPEAGA